MKGVRGPRIPGKRIQKPKKGKGNYTRKPKSRKVDPKSEG